MRDDSGKQRHPKENAAEEEGMLSAGRAHSS